jgi:hypothetical protein
LVYDLKYLDPDHAEWKFEPSLAKVTETYERFAFPLYEDKASYESLDRLVWQIAAELANTPDIYAYRLGRLVAYRDARFPTSIEIAMDIGSLDFEKILRAHGRMDD